MLVLLIGAVLAIPIAFYILCAGRNWWFLDPINTFWPGYILFGVVEPWSFRQDWIDIYGADTTIRTQTMYLVAGVCVCIGYRLRLGDRVASMLPAVRGRDHNQKFVILGVTVCVIGLAAYAYVIAASGGLYEFLAISRTNIDYSEISGYVINLLAFVPLGLLILLCVSYSVSHYVFLRKGALVGTLAYAAWAVYSGTRSGIIAVAVILLGSVYGPRRRHPHPLIAVLALGVVVVLVGFTKQYRSAFYGGQFHGDETSHQMLENSLKSYVNSASSAAPLGAEFSVSAAVVQYVPDMVPYDRGHMLLELFTRAVPRSLWLDKVYPEGEAWDRIHRIAGTAGWINAAGYVSGPAPSLVGKWYYIGGALGIVIGGVWTGVFLQAIRKYTLRYSGVARVILAVGFAPLGFSEMNNPMLWPITWLPTTGVGILLIVILSRKGASDSCNSRFADALAISRSGGSSLTGGPVTASSTPKQEPAI